MSRHVLWAVCLLSTIVLVVCLFTVPRLADSPVPSTIAAIEPSASPELRDEGGPSGRRVRLSESSAARNNGVRRPRPTADRERDLFLGLMFYLGGQQGR
jgi:hypothetical protein